MYDVLMWACTYMLTMLLAYWLKRIGIFKTEDRKVFANLVFYVTLPAMLVSSFSGVKADFWFIAAFVLGLAVNLLMVCAACAASAKRPDDIKGIYTINGAGLNLGNIGIPFLRNFFPAAVPYLCMFDTGDSFFSLGTTYAIAEMRMGRKSGPKLKAILSSLLHSVPMIAYMVMTALSLLDVRLPEPILELADFMGKGNGFIVMVMVGISLEIHISKEAKKEVFRLLMLRYACGAVSAAAIYFLLPAPLEMRQALAPAMFAAVPSACLIYTERLNVRMDIASALNPISAVLMIPAATLVILLVQ